MAMPKSAAPSTTQPEVESSASAPEAPQPEIFPESSTMPNNPLDKLTSLFKRTPKPTDSDETHTAKEASSRLETTKKPFLKKTWVRIMLVLMMVFVLVGGVGIAVGLHTYAIAMDLKTQAEEAETIGRAAYTNFKTQNLPASKEEMKKLQGKVDEIRATYDQLSFYSSVPVASAYYQDGVHGLNAAEAGLRAGVRAVEAVEPHADLLGFTGEGTFEGGSAENRIKLILETLTQVTPIMDEVQADLETVQTELDQINPERYPEEFRGIQVRSQLAEAKLVLSQASELLTNYRPILEKLPEIAGATGERKKYLILFQNDNELRPTGGFLTAYAVVYIEDGVITPEKSDDIYEVDQKFTQRIEIPEQLGRYLTTERYWNLRDMNINPDFKESMDTFFQYYEEVPGEPDDIDGIIAVDTHVLAELVEIVGPVEVPGYGTFSAENDPRCDCPQIIYALSEIITRPTPYLREDRKGILAPLMQGTLAKLYSSPRTYMADLFDLGLTKVGGRHIQVYFFNEDHQAAAEAINAAGRMLPPQEGTDFLAVVNANLGGAKSNLFIDYEMEQVVSAPQAGMIEKQVELTYKNSRPGDNCNLEAGLLCLNSTNRDWTRIYVPLGSELVEAQGFNEEALVYEEDGFTVIEGFFILEPNSQAKVRLTYNVPYSDQDTYRLKLWKQGGVNPIPVLMDVTGGQEEILLDQDQVYTTPF